VVTVRLVLAFIFTMAMTWWPAMAASTDYDGKWHLEGNCSASLARPTDRAIEFWTNITIQNGSVSEVDNYVASGKKAEDSWSGSIQNSNLTLVDDGQNDRSARWRRNLTGHAVSSADFVFEGNFFQWIAPQWVHTRTCKGKLHSVDPVAVSLAGRERTLGGPAQNADGQSTKASLQEMRQAAADLLAAQQRERAASEQLAAQQRQQADAVQRVTLPGPVLAASPGIRVALVIGNGAYVNADPLRNPVNDANSVAAVLRTIGFDVVEGVDLTRLALEEKIRDFLRKALHARIALLFYSGHGMQVDGKNYLIPVDARLAEPTDLFFETVEIDKTLDALSDPGRTTIILLDACRDNPLARHFRSRLPVTRSAAVPSGLAAYSAVGTGTLIAYATAPGQTALDGQGQNSPFTTSLLRYLPLPGLEIRQLLTRVRADVAAATRDKQIPWDNSSLMGDVYLVK
jgi:hypothetical protein